MFADEPVTGGQIRFDPFEEPMEQEEQMDGNGLDEKSGGLEPDGWGALQENIDRFEEPDWNALEDAYVTGAQVDWDSLEEIIPLSKRELVLALTTSVLAGIVVGVFFGPKKQ